MRFERCFECRRQHQSIPSNPNIHKGSDHRVALFGGTGQPHCKDPFLAGLQRLEDTYKKIGSSSQPEVQKLTKNKVLANVLPGADAPVKVDHQLAVGRIQVAGLRDVQVSQVVKPGVAFIFSRELRLIEFCKHSISDLPSYINFTCFYTFQSRPVPLGVRWQGLGVPWIFAEKMVKHSFGRGDVAFLDKSRFEIHTALYKSETASNT